MRVAFAQTLVLIINLYFLRIHAKGLARVIPTSGVALGLIGLFGPSVWDWCRSSVGVGLLGFWTLNHDELVRFHLILLCYSTGVSFGNFYLINMKETSILVRNNLQKEGRSSLYIFSLLGFFVYLLGQGSSLFYNDSYLITNGIGVIQRLASTILLPLLAVSSYLVATAKSRSQLTPAILLQMLWAICFLGTGSRSAVIALVSLFLVLVYRNKNI